jgi:uncharacterized protein YjbI with pentapeptide repeats
VVRLVLGEAGVGSDEGRYGQEDDIECEDDRTVRVMPPFARIGSQLGVLVIGSPWEPERSVETLREDIERGAVTSDRVSFALAVGSSDAAERQRVVGENEADSGFVCVSLASAAEFLIHRLDSSSGTYVSWAAGSGVADLGDADLVFERVGPVFGDGGDFELAAVEAIGDSSEAMSFDADGDEDLRDCSTHGVRITWHGTVAGRFASEAYLVYRDGEPIGLYIEGDEDEDEDGDGFPQRDRIRCRMAPALVNGEQIATGILKRVDLRGRDFSGWDLAGVVFDHSDLRGADFSGCDLRGASFAFARADGAVFDRASLGDASLDFIYAPGASFVNASLEKASFAYAELARSVFRSANLQGACLDSVSVDEGDWREVDLAGASVAEAAFITGTDLSNANLAGANFEGCDLSDSILDGVDLSEVSLGDATMPDGTIHE